METGSDVLLCPVPSTVDSRRMNEKVLAHFPGGDSFPSPGNPLCQDISAERSHISVERSPSCADMTCPLEPQLRVRLLSQPAEKRIGAACSHDCSHLLPLVLDCFLGHTPTLPSVANPLGMQSLEPGGFRPQPLYLGKVANFLRPCPPES